jgi:hypothetical protein
MVPALTAALVCSVAWCAAAAGAEPTATVVPQPGPPRVHPVPPALPPPADPAPTTPPPPTAVDPAARLAVLTTVRDVAARAGGTVQVAVRDADGTPAFGSPDAGAPVWTASLVKLLVVQQLFAREAAGSLSLSAAELDQMQRAVTSSDDGAMSALWDRFGGAELVAAAAAEFGLSGSAPPAVPGAWGEAVTTAADTAAFLAGLDDHLPAEDLATLTGWMRSASGIADDGFDQRFGLLSPAVSAGTPIAAKQGWMCCVDGRRQLHSAARSALDQAAAAVVSAP